MGASSQQHAFRDIDWSAPSSAGLSRGERAVQWAPRPLRDQALGDRLAPLGWSCVSSTSRPSMESDATWARTTPVS